MKQDTPANLSIIEAMNALQVRELPVGNWIYELISLQKCVNCVSVPSGKGSTGHQSVFSIQDRKHIAHFEGILCNKFTFLGGVVASRSIGYATPVQAQIRHKRCPLRAAPHLFRFELELVTLRAKEVTVFCI